MIKKRSSWIFLILVFPVLLEGADKTKKAYELIYQDVQHLKKQILQLDKKIERNQEDIKTIMKHLEEILALSILARSQQASFKEDQKKIPAQYQILLEKLDSVNSQLSKFSEELMEIKKASPPTLEEPEQEKQAQPEKTPPPKKETVEEKKEEQTEEEPKPSISPNLSPQEVYNMARSDYLKGNFQLSIDGFKIYIEQFPESPFADNALYWIGECYFSQKDFEKAIEQFNQLLLSYPRGDKIPAAYLKKGISFMELEKKEEALSVLKLLISKYPLEEETKIAQQKIKELSLKK